MCGKLSSGFSPKFEEHVTIMSNPNQQATPVRSGTDQQTSPTSTTGHFANPIKTLSILGYPISVKSSLSTDQIQALLNRINTIAAPLRSSNKPFIDHPVSTQEALLLVLTMAEQLNTQELNASNEITALKTKLRDLKQKALQFTSSLKSLSAAEIAASQNTAVIEEDLLKKIEALVPAAETAPKTYAEFNQQQT